MTRSVQARDLIKLRENQTASLPAGAKGSRSRAGSFFAAAYFLFSISSHTPATSAEQISFIAFLLQCALDLQSHTLLYLDHQGRWLSTCLPMVYLESFCAAAFTLGSAACVLNLLVLPQQQQQHSAQLVFVTCLLVICVLSTVALWSVEGRHACWHHGCPGESTGGKEAATTETQTEEPHAAEAPRSCADVMLDPASNELPSEDFPLERRSSFVVSSVSNAAILSLRYYIDASAYAFVGKLRVQVEVATVFAWVVVVNEQPEYGWLHENRVGIVRHNSSTLDQL